MNIETIVVGPIETNCYIVWNDANRALVIDPGDEPEDIIGFISQKKLDIAAYVATHGHMDHISALASIAKQYPAPIGMHIADKSWAFGSENRMPPFYDVPQRPKEIARDLEDGQQCNDAGLEYKIIATPGHSPGGICIYFPGEHVLFSGDTLFNGSAGRTDLPGGDDRILTQSLRKLANLPKKTIIYPGHGPSTSMDIELRSNPFISF